MILEREDDSVALELTPTKLNLVAVTLSEQIQQHSQSLNTMPN
jgi:hypothetical protein